MLKHLCPNHVSDKVSDFIMALFGHSTSCKHRESNLRVLCSLLTIHLSSILRYALRHPLGILPMRVQQKYHNHLFVQSFTVQDNPLFNWFDHQRSCHQSALRRPTGSLPVLSKMALASQQLYTGTGDSSTQSKPGTAIAITSVCNNHKIQQGRSGFNLPQRPANPFLFNNDENTNGAADAASSAPNRHLGILEAALDITLVSGPASARRDNENIYLRPPSHTIKICRSRRTTRSSGCASRRENDNHSLSDADSRAQDKQLYDMATWRMYHRIMESRRRQPSTCSLDATALCKAKQEAAATYTKGAMTTTSPHPQRSHDDEPKDLLVGATRPLVELRSSSILDAAIFDLDL